MILHVHNLWVRLVLEPGYHLPVCELEDAWLILPILIFHQLTVELKLVAYVGVSQVVRVNICRNGATASLLQDARIGD